MGKIDFYHNYIALLSLGGWGGGWCCGSGEVVEVGNLGEDV